MSERMKSGLGPAPLIILVEPQMGENIGAAARAMLNFGLTSLRIVNPRDGWPNAAAGAMAAGASTVVDNARIFDSVPEAIADCTYVLATTARKRELHLPVYEPKAAAQALQPRVAAGETCAILFGGERSGLATEHVALAQGIFTIPVNPAFSSLNLGAAVLVAAYEWGNVQGETRRFDSRLDAATPAAQADVEGLVGHLFNTLEPTGYFHPPEKRETMERNLRTVLTRVEFTQNEIHLLRGVLKALGRRA
ncbi:RNA methyltransferase [Parvularcula sp. IMCC14364]|uniref:RNA methyltransferase n=1 Tax=Parvularcula sp. IMCC14364 TaxID=3067902 RepID=UPI0027418C55|nr:RNA methyltransferase [Parvularcula sp. IMCC14364]